MPSINKVKNWYAQSFEVRSVASSLSASISLIHLPQELISFPPIRLPPDIRAALMTQATESLSLPESHPNPSLQYQYYSDDYTSAPPPTGIGIVSTPKNGNGRSNGNAQKMRIPMERRSVPSPLLVRPKPSLNLHLFVHPAPSVPISPLPRYYANTSTVKEWPPEVREYNRAFTKTLETIKKRHDPTVTTIAQGVLEWKRSQNARNINLDVQHWLDRFYMSRIGIRFLIGQRTSSSLPLPLSLPPSHHRIIGTDIALNTLQPHPDYVGIICTSAVRVR